MNTDKEVGAAIAEARIGAGMSQRVLALHMRKHGWMQATVSKIELGERKLSYLEARTLRQIIPFDSETEVPKTHWRKNALQTLKLLIEQELENE